MNTFSRTAIALLLAVLGLTSKGCAAFGPDADQALPPQEANIDIRGLPVLEFPSSHPSDTFAVMLTGDGGWRHIDDTVTKHLREAGVSVIGFNSPRYLSVERTPDETAADVARVIRHYLEAWNERRVILVGYSRGSEMLPFVVNRLAPDLQEKVAVVALLGPSAKAEFVYHFFSFFYRGKDKEYDVLPEVQKIRGQKVVCVQGRREKDSLCPAMTSFATVYVVPGAHHFAGDYSGIAHTILEEAAKRR